jgi:hypothetical protein
MAGRDLFIREKNSGSIGYGRVVVLILGNLTIVLNDIKERRFDVVERCRTEAIREIAAEEGRKFFNAIEGEN